MQPTLERQRFVLPVSLPLPALKPMSASARLRLLCSLGGVAFIVLGWHILAQHTHAAIVASPADTWAALQTLAGSGQLWAEMAVTLRRLLSALVLGCALGFSLGLAAGFSPACRAFLEPLRWVVMTLPTVFIAVLGLLWFGMGDTQVIFLVAIITTPIVYVNTVSGFATLDRQLLEMGRVYRFTRWQALSEIYLPGIGSSVVTGLTLAAGIGVRAVIMAELLGAFGGLGHSFNQAWTFLRTPQLFAWMLASLALMVLLEAAVLRPARRFVTRWRRAQQEGLDR